MTIHKLYKKCGCGENSMLWDALGWCRNRAGRKSRAVRKIRGEVYSDFGFFGTMLAPRSSGLARKMHFSVGDSFCTLGESDRHAVKFLLSQRKSRQNAAKWSVSNGISAKTACRPPRAFKKIRKKNTEVLLTLHKGCCTFIVVR